MIPAIQTHRTELDVLCRKYHVRRLDVFGSAAGGQFDPDKSDLDFLVEFEALEPATCADAYFGLLESLEKLFGRPVDLVSARAVTNPYFRQAIEQTKALLYAA